MTEDDRHIPDASRFSERELESPYAQQWRARARQVRTQAQQMTHPNTKYLMLGVADDYERLTQIAEAMALIRGVLASAIEAD